MPARRKKTKKNNIVIRGLEAKDKPIKEIVTKFIEEKFKVGEAIVEVWINGPKENEIIIVEMRSWEEKQVIMKNKNILKGKGREKEVYIDHDLTKEERGVQRKLRELAKEEEKKGNDVRVGYRKMKIGDEWYKWNEEKESLEPDRRK